MYEEFEQDHKIKQKMITFYRNGNKDKSFIIKLQKTHQIIQEIIKTFNFETNTKVRFFNEHGTQYIIGVEIFEDDLQYLKDGNCYYVSKGTLLTLGEDFDTNSSFSEYNIIKQIGEGGFGKVMLAQHKENNEKVAIKIVNTKTIGNAQDIDMVFMEAELLKSLRHKNIVTIKRCFTLANMQVVFIMEYCEGGELLEYVVSKGTLDEKETKFFVQQIASALYYLHREKLIHRDLKLENLLLLDSQSKQLKLVDFGISGVSNIQTDNADAGSLKYMAPEFFDKSKKSSPTASVVRFLNQDMWALGVIIYTMLVGKLPFDGQSSHEVIDKICNSKYLIPENIEKELSLEIKDLLSRLLEKNYKCRISSLEIMDHPFIDPTKNLQQYILQFEKQKPVIQALIIQPKVPKELQKKVTVRSPEATATSSQFPKKNQIIKDNDLKKKK